MKRAVTQIPEILEDLAYRVAVQIDLSAETPFDSALEEMLEYHRFLVAAYATTSQEGNPFSYGLIEDTWLSRKPHWDWIRQYRQLFEKAANRLHKSDYFFKALAGVSVRLLPPADQRPPHEILSAILDLGPSQIHFAEEWRKIRAGEPGEQLSERDHEVYQSVLVDFVGMWESLLQVAPSVFQWPDDDNSIADATWLRLRESWPYLLHHLRNTVRLLGIAVDSGDWDGSKRFRDALVRWIDVLSYRFSGALHLPSSVQLFPDVLESSWSGAAAKLEALAPSYHPETTPYSLFEELLLSTHRDVLLVSSALLINWSLNQGRHATLALRSADDLLKGELIDDDGRLHQVSFDFQTTLRTLTHTILSGSKYPEETHGAFLDSIVSRLETLTEPRRVPGRVYSTSTMDSRLDLAAAYVVILLSRISEEEITAGVSFVENLAKNANLLPADDRSLRDVLQSFRQLKNQLSLGQERLEIAVGSLSPEQPSFDMRIELLSGFLDAAVDKIESHRSKRLDELPVDQKRLAALRKTVEEAITEPPAGVPFFKDFIIARKKVALGDLGTFRVTGVSKGELTDPPMDIQSANFDDAMVAFATNHLAGRIVTAFARRPRRKIELSARIEDVAFWRIAAEKGKEVGPEPTILVSRQDHLYRFLYTSKGAAESLRIEHKQQKAEGSYLGTIEGIDVFSAELSKSEAWLFSARSLERVEYGALGEQDQLILVDFEPADDKISGALRFQFEQIIKFKDLPIIELHFPLQSTSPSP